MYSTRFSCRFERNLDFLNRFSKNTQISNFMRLRPLAADFHADERTDGQTDRHGEANSLCSQLL